MVAADQQGEPPYAVGYKRPPKNYQFKPGQRGNPKGRPRGSKNAKTMIEEGLYEKLPVRKGETTSKEPSLEVITKTFVRKAAQGDAKAAAIVINLATKSGVFGGGRENAPSQPAPDPSTTARDLRPSATLVESVDLGLLSQDEQIELSKLAERIDAGGGVVALSGGEFERLKQIINTGRGDTVAPQAGDAVDQAA